MSQALAAEAGRLQATQPTTARSVTGCRIDTVLGANNRLIGQ
jgi:hypothetical protein